MPRSGRDPACSLTQPLLDQAVFQRVERHNDQPAAGFKHLLSRCQPTGQLAQLVVHVHSDRLEGMGRRMGPRAAPPAHGHLHQRRQIRLVRVYR